MKLGLVLPMATGDAERVLSFARRAEDLGFDGVFAPDHLFAPGAPADRPSMEAFATLAAVAATTARMSVGTLVARTSLRPAGILAKSAITLDDLSGGRFVLGVGSGDELSRPEHEAFGIPYLGPSARRTHLIETIEALRALFRGEPWGGGRHVPPIDGPLLPAPTTPGRPPIWVGGTSVGTVRVAASLADGWNGWGIDVATFAERVRLLRSETGDRQVEATWGGAMVIGTDPQEAEALVAARRERGLGQAWAGDADGASAWLEGLAHAGATWAIVLAAGPPDRAELVAERILPSVRAIA